jgi:hypothetical protein
MVSGAERYGSIGVHRGIESSDNDDLRSALAVGNSERQGDFHHGDFLLW